MKSVNGVWSLDSHIRGRRPGGRTTIFARAKKSPLAARVRHLAVAVAMAGVMSGANAQGVPVIDIANVGQAIIMVQQLMQQVQVMGQQYQTLMSQLAAVTGNRGLGQILNDPALVNYLPGDWQGIYQQVTSGQLPSITSAVTQIEQAEGMAATTAGQQRANDTLASNKAMAMQAYQATIGRLQNIQGLMQQSNLTQDPAAKADLQNRLNAEVAMVNNEQTRINLMMKLGDIEEKLASQQRFSETQRTMFGSTQ